MFLIDQGEKKLIRRTLLDENDNPIPWDRIIDIRFDLTIGGQPLKTYSKQNGTVRQIGSDVGFEITQEDSKELPPTAFDLKATIDVNDDRFSDLMTDSQWEYRFTVIRLNINNEDPYSGSSNVGSIKFAVIPQTIEGTDTTPESAPALGDPATTASTLNISYSPVNRATSYDYQIEFGVIVDNGSALTISLSDLPANSTDRIRVRGKNIDGEGPWSPYKSFTTNPIETPNATITTTLDTAVITINNLSNYELEANFGNLWVNQGSADTINRFNLQEGTEYSTALRFKNDGGVGPETSYTYTTKQLPESKPIILDTTPSANGVTVDITLVTGITGVEYRLDAGTVVPVGLVSEFEVTTGNPGQTYNLEVRYTNESGGGDWSLVEVITIPQVTGITVTPSSIDDHVGSTHELNVSLQTIGGADESYTISIADNTIATVSQNDIVTLLLEGSTQIVVESVFDNTISQTINVASSDIIISDPSLDIENLTIEGGDVVWTKATGNNSTSFEYTLYTGNETDLNSTSTIITQSLVTSGVDVATLPLSGFEGEFIEYGLLVEDTITGQRRVYNANNVLFPEQEVTDVEIYDQDPAVFTSEVPIVSFQNSGSLDLSSEQGTIRLHAKVAISEGADDTVSWTTSDATKVSITVIDDYTADINYVTSQPGDVVTITATSDFDSFFKASIDVALFADTPVANTESTTFELQT